jgi:hypothetical protein
MAPFHCHDRMTYRSTVGAPGGLSPLPPFVIHSPKSRGETQFCLGPLQTTLSFYIFALVWEAHLLCEYHIVQSCSFLVMGQYRGKCAAKGCRHTWNHKCFQGRPDGRPIPSPCYIFPWKGSALILMIVFAQVATKNILQQSPSLPYHRLHLRLPLCHQFHLLQ